MAVSYPIGAIHRNLVLVVVNTLLVSIASITIGLRIWSRRLSGVGIELDDFLIIVAMVIVYVLYTMAILDIKYGMRRTVTSIPGDNLTILLKMLIAYQLLYGTAMLMVKWSYLTFFTRIFSIRRDFTKWAYILMAIVALWWFGNTLQIFLVCHPFALNWDPYLPGTCGNRPLAFVLVSALNIATDIGIILLPLPYIRSLQMPERKKWGLTLMFGIGLLITAISGIRLSVLAKLSFSDISYDMLDSVFWTVIEPSVAIINACLPMMRRPLFKIAPSIFPLSTDQHSHQPRTLASNRRTGRVDTSEDEIQLTKVGKEEVSIAVTGGRSGASSSMNEDEGHGENIWVQKTLNVTYM